MPHTRKRQVWLAKISRRESTLLDNDFPSDLLVALDPTIRVHRYNREWRLSKPEQSGPFIVGKLGFERPARREEVHYDEEAQDFVVESAPSEQGNFSYYVIEGRKQVLAFELRPPDIYAKSFLGALQKILSQSHPRFEIDLLSDVHSFEAWLESVDTVTRFFASLKPPNPSSSRRAREVRSLMDETDAERISIEATSSEEGGGLTIKNTLLEAAADHAAEGNGRFRLSALKGGARRFFDSSNQLLTGQIEVSANDDEPSILRKLMQLARDLLRDRSDHD